MKKLFGALVFMPVIGWAQMSDSLFIKKMSDDIMGNGKAYENLRQLTKNIGGRLAGSAQMTMAENWGAETLKALGADKVYMQECKVPNWNRGGEDKATIIKIGDKKEKRSLDVLALGNSMGSGKKGITAEVLALASFAELEERSDEVKGKIVFFNYGFNPTNLQPFRSYGDAGIYRRIGASRAAKYGAVAILIRSLTEANDNNPHTGVMAYNDTFPKIPAAALGLKDADYLWTTCKRNPSVRVSLFTNGSFLPEATGHNVIAELKGTQFPNEFITVGGHLDSWDVNEGAHDDGAGIVQTMEVMRALKAMNYTPKRTLRFVLFANEENGGAGGDAYAAAAIANNEKHIFALESDAGGFTPRGFGFTTSPEKLSKVMEWKSLFLPYGVYDFRQGGGGSDIGPLNRKLGTSLAGLSPDGQRYFDVHHARSDVFENVNKRELHLGAVNMAALIYLVDKYGL
ncbi:MAG: M20/M25/M40 family metallo-hydrolase [Chitinophagaceae bacterium]|nr:M20/M25/M40 family metallo-hydrolase [Chitinophagaceae bacterium]